LISPTLLEEVAFALRDYSDGKIQSAAGGLLQHDTGSKNGPEAPNSKARYLSSAATSGHMIAGIILGRAQITKALRELGYKKTRRSTKQEAVTMQSGKHLGA
jgi:hypothetical protein